MIMSGDLEPYEPTPFEITRGIRNDLVRQGADPQKIEIHYHAAPSQAPAPVTPTADPMAPAARLAPYFVILLGGAIILALVAVITIVLVPAIMALATTVAIIMCGFAITVVAVAAAVRSLRTSKYDVKNRR